MTTTDRQVTSTSAASTATLVPQTTTPIYEPPTSEDSTSSTTVPSRSSTNDTIPARPETQPDVAFVADDGEVEATIQVVDSQEVPTGLSAQGRLVLTTGNFVKVRGKGFERAGFAEVWLFSTPQLLGRVPKDASGNFVGRVRIPENLEAGEHTIELRAVTRRAKLVAVSAPAIVIAGESSGDSATTTSAPAGSTESTLVDISSGVSAGVVTSPPAESTPPIRITPGATEVVLPSDAVLSVVTEILGPGVDPLTASVRVRVAPFDWQPFALDSQESATLPLAKDSVDLEIEVTPQGGSPIVRSIALVNETGNSRLWLILVAALAASLVASWWLVAARRRRRDDEVELDEDIA
ncbi:MAG: hypothetical protein EB148_00470 [Actinobacteria bacterium]|nr:hypothetical protein [Actinomycetota bacterium]